MCLIIFLITSFLSINFSCTSKTKPSTEATSNLKESKKDSLPHESLSKVENDTVTTGLIKRTVNGNIIELKLDGRYTWRDPNETNHALNFVEEVYPGVVHFRKYFEQRLLDEYSEETIQVKFPVNDKIEFFDENNNLIKTFLVDQNNPYLNPQNGITIREHYINEEFAEYSPPADKSELEKVTEYHLKTSIEFNSGFSKINYWVDLVKDQRKILGKKTTLVILDTLGNEIFNHEFDGFASPPAITKNKKYVIFAQFPIESLADADIITKTDGFEIWDTEANTRIYKEENDNPDRWISLPFIDDHGKILVQKYTYPNSKILGEHVVLFDSENKVLYRRDFSVEQWREISLNWYKKYKSFAGLINSFEFETSHLTDE